jgi:hypothetical protein
MDDAREAANVTVPSVSFQMRTVIGSGHISSLGFVIAMKPAEESADDHFYQRKP